MPTRNINLTQHQDKLIAKLIESGRYQSASEVVRDSMRLLEDKETEYQAKLSALLEAAKLGEAAYQSGEFARLETEGDIDRMFDEIEADLETGRRSKDAA
jgi:antitoxin ParD1/3/4